MENNTLLIGILSINIAALLALGLLKLIFKSSVVFTIGIIFLIVIDSIASMAFFVGGAELYHLFWGVPVSVILLFSAYYLVAVLVQRPLQVLTDSVTKISEGDLEVMFDDKLKRRKDEFGSISRSIDSLGQKLQSVIRETFEISDQLSMASQTMSVSAEQLSRGASEQAASSEEVSSSMEEMSANISQNADNAKQTEIIAKKSVDGIRQGYESSRNNIQKIQEISEKISVINDIAFQTNILALNAAVEAARAGEHGKGFAVVASEVRKLAEKSKVSAEYISNLSKDGVESIISLGKMLEELVPEIEKTSTLVQEITSASLEQDSGATQINMAVQQLSQVTQANAATSEELAGSSTGLAEMSDRLLKNIRFFKIRREKNYDRQSYYNKATTNKPVLEKKNVDEPAYF